MPTKNEAVNEAYQFLSEQVLSDFDDVLAFSDNTGDW